jgi:hypothetical protein
MSSLQKGDIIINPNTQRPVKVGSRTWLKLVKQGVVDGSYSDPKILKESYELDDVEDTKKQLNAKLPSNKQAVKGRGIHKGKIVTRNKRLSPDDMARHTAKASASAMTNHMDELEELDDDELERRLEALILKEMIAPPKLQRAKSRANNLRPVSKGDLAMYELSDAECEDYDSEEPVLSMEDFDDDEDSLQW